MVNADNENWRLIESANDLTGKWEGNTTIEIPENLHEMMPKTSVNVRTIFEYSKNTKTEDSDCKFFMNIDFGKFLDDFLNLPDFKIYPGITKDSLWDMLSLVFNSMDEIAGFDIAVEKYTLNFSFDGEVSAMFMNGSQGQILLNSSKNKMKLLFNSEIPLGFGNDEFTELILYKVQ
jgi:hypothetical protein